MRAGLLQYRITVVKPDIEKNQYGEDACEYVPKFTTRARVEYNSGNRVLENNEIFFDYGVTFTIGMYHFGNINHFDRIIFEKNQYRILSIELQKQMQCVIIRTELINE